MWIYIVVALQCAGVLTCLVVWIKGEFRFRTKRVRAFAEMNLNSEDTETLLPGISPRRGRVSGYILFTSVAGVLVSILKIALITFYIHKGRPCTWGGDLCTESVASWLHAGIVGMSFCAALGLWPVVLMPFIENGTSQEDVHASHYYAAVGGCTIVFLCEAYLLAFSFMFDDSVNLSNPDSGMQFAVDLSLVALGICQVMVILGCRWLFMLPAVDIMSLCTSVGDDRSRLTKSSICLPKELSLSISLNDKWCGSTAKTLWRQWRWSLVTLGVVRVVQEALGLLPALLLRDLVDTLNSDAEMTDMVRRRELGLVLGITACSLIGSLMRGHYDLKFSKMGIHARGYLSAIVYWQASLLPHDERAKLQSNSKANASTVVNHLLVDVPRVCDQMSNLHNLWCLPLQVGFALYLLSLQLSFGFLAGLFIAAAMIPINAVLAKKIQKINTSFLSSNDERVESVTSVLQNIKFIKMCGWSGVVKRWIAEPREREMKSLAWVKYLDAACCFFWATTPVIVSLVSFVTYAGIFDGVLTPGKVVASLSLFNTLILPLNSYPWVLNGAVEAYVSLNRLDAFLHCFSSESSSSNHTGIVPQFPNVCLRRTEESHLEVSAETLNVSIRNFPLKRGHVTHITGSSGSGKSSFLEALAGELSFTTEAGESLRSPLVPACTVAYLPQHAFIMRGTVRANIQFHTQTPQSSYAEVLRLCRLNEDVANWAEDGGDLKETGEGGANLSGGQMHRVALARALLADADVYLIDDFFGSLDQRVAKDIILATIVPLLRRNKAVVVVSDHPDLCAALEDPAVPSFSFQLHNSVVKLLPKDKEPDVDPEDVLTLPGAEEYLFGEEDTARLNSTPTEDDPGDEVVEEGSISLEAFQVYLRGVGVPLFVGVLVSVALMQAVRNGSEYYVASWTNVHSTDSSSKSVPAFLAVLAYFACGNIVIAVVRSVSFAYAGLLACRRIHDNAIDRILAASYFTFFSQNSVGRVINRISRDIYVIDDNLPFMLNVFVAQLFLLIGGVSIIGITSSPFVLLAAVPVGLAVFAIQKPYRVANRNIKRLEAAMRSPMVDVMTAVLEGGSVIRPFGRDCEEFVLRMSQTSVIQWQRANFNLITLQWWFNLAMQGIGAGIVLVVGMAAVLGTWYGGLSVGATGLALAYVSPLTGYISNLLGSFTELEKNFISVERVGEYLRLEAETATALDLQVSCSHSEGLQSRRASEVGFSPRASDVSVSSAVASYGAVSGSSLPIDLEQVCVSYNGGRSLALNNISLRIIEGSRVAVVGRTGSGKSTLMSVLCAMVPIHVEGGGLGSATVLGQNLAAMDLDKYRSMISIVPQEVFVLSGSILANLFPFSDLSVLSAVSLSLHRYVGQLALVSIGLKNLQLDRNVTNDTLSTGERHLINIARVMCMSLDMKAQEDGVRLTLTSSLAIQMEDSGTFTRCSDACPVTLVDMPALSNRKRLLLIDEPSAYLGAAEEDTMWRGLLGFFLGTTVVCVTHKLATLRKYFTMVVQLDRGRIRAVGSVESVLGKQEG